MAQQTAVEWLIRNVNENIPPMYIPKQVVEQAKAMEKEQIEKAFDVGFGRGHECGENHDWHEGENRGWEFYDQEYLGKKNQLNK